MYYNNPFNNGPFKQSDLTQSINALEVKYNRISQMDLFQVKRIAHTHASVEMRKSKNQLVPATPRGTRVNFLETGKQSNRRLYTFEVPHYEINDTITPSDLQDFGNYQNTGLMTLSELSTERLALAKQRFVTTIEYAKVNCLQGRILDADGSLIFDYFDEFNATQTQVDLSLSSLPETQSSCNEITRAIDLAVGEDFPTGYKGLASDTTFDGFQTADSTKEAFAGYMRASEMLGGDQRKGFMFGGIEWINYNPIVLDGSGTGTTRKFIPEGEAIVFPVGTRDTFLYYISPADTLDTVNKRGTEFFSKSWYEPGGDTFVLHSEVNVLPICTRPDALIRVVKG